MDMWQLVIPETLRKTCSSHDSAPDSADPTTLSTRESSLVCGTPDHVVSVIDVGDLDFKATRMSNTRFWPSHTLGPGRSSQDSHAIAEDRGALSYASKNKVEGDYKCSYSGRMKHAFPTRFSCCHMQYS
jgi:hypothetical protein